jgi:hypothetical protein
VLQRFLLAELHLDVEEDPLRPGRG